jgi:hypothetical protein
MQYGIQTPISYGVNRKRSPELVVHWWPERDMKTLFIKEMILSTNTCYTHQKLYSDAVFKMANSHEASAIQSHWGPHVLYNKVIPYSQLHNFSQCQKFVKYITTNLWMAWITCHRQILTPLSKGIVIYVWFNLCSSMCSTYHPSIINSSLCAPVHCCFKNYINHIDCSI